MRQRLSSGRIRGPIWLWAHAESRMPASGPLTPARRLDFAYGAAHNQESQDAAATDRVPNVLAEQEIYAFPLRTPGKMKAGDACARDDWT